MSVRSCGLLFAPLLLVALWTPDASAEHIQGMVVSQSDANGLAVTLRVDLINSGKPHGGTFHWSTDDGANGSLDDGVTNGVYQGDASGTGALTDSRPFTWNRSSPAASLVRIEITYSYFFHRTYKVQWEDCCPYTSGTTAVQTNRTAYEGASFGFGRLGTKEFGDEAPRGILLGKFAECFDTTASGAPMLKFTEWNGKFLGTDCRYQFGITGSCRTETHYNGRMDTTCAGLFVLQIRF